MRTLSPIVLALVTLLAAGSTRGPAPAMAQPKPVVWNLPTVAAPSYYHTLNLTAFANRVKEKSGGRMEIRIHPASSLYPGPEMLPALMDGRVEISPVLSGYLTDVMLEMGVLELPFMTGNLDEHRKAAEAMRGFVTESMAKRGLKLLTIHAWPTQQLFSNTPLRTVADWKGKKLRVYGAESADIVKTVGGAPVNIPFGEVYVALQRGTVDGAMTSATNAEPMKFYEVAKYINYWYLTGGSLEWLAVNQKIWTGLAADLQQAVLGSLVDVKFEDKEWADAKVWEERARKRMPELGMTIVEPAKEEIDKARNLSKAAWDVWLKRTGPEGKRAMEIALKALGR